MCKLDAHRKVRRGYIAMLAVDENYRKQHIGIYLMIHDLLKLTKIAFKIFQ